MKYQIGQKVRVVESTYWSNLNTAAAREAVGQTGPIKDVDAIDNSYAVWIKDSYGESTWCWYRESDLAPLEATWDSLVAGETVLVNSNLEAMVLEIGSTGRTFLLSADHDFSCAYEWYTVVQAQESGWTIKQPESVSHVSNALWQQKHTHLLGTTVSGEHDLVAKTARSMTQDRPDDDVVVLDIEPEYITIDGRDLNLQDVIAATSHLKEVIEQPEDKEEAS